MRVAAIIPVKSLDNAKLRLSSLLTQGQRREFTVHMLHDVIKAVIECGEVDRCIVVSPDDEALAFAKSLGADVLKEKCEKGVDAAVHKANSHALNLGMRCTVVFPADLPLITPSDIEEIVKAGRQDESVVITPSVRLDGTNALLRRPPQIMRTFYEQDSFNSHLQEATRKGLRVKVILSRRVMLDIDTRDDLFEFLSKERPCSTYDWLVKFLKKR